MNDLMPSLLGLSMMSVASTGAPCACWESLRGTEAQRTPSEKRVSRAIS